MLSLLGQSFWLALPVILAGILHMVVVKKDLLVVLKRPIDGGRSIRGERIFGDNKTWRGLAVMVGLSAILGAGQGFFLGDWARRSGASVVDLSTRDQLLASPTPLDEALAYALVNAVLGLGYALGELPNSFLKRRVKIEPGKTGSGALGAFFFVLDQADSVIAAFALGALVFGLSLRLVLVGSIALTLLHLALNAALYLLRVRKNL